MVLRASDINAFMETADAAVLVRVAAALGSTPRERGAYMLVAADDVAGTIGGGQLEYIAIDTARQMLRQSKASDKLDVPLGPEIGQCCGGRVQIALERIDDEVLARLLNACQAARAAEPSVILFGAGHVGRALALALAPLPYQTTLVDTRADMLGGLPEAINVQVTALPEAAVRAARPGSAFVVLTHDHALDFLIMREVLLRGDAAYAGMIGSKSKRAQFRHWFTSEGGDEARLIDLVCPIGAQGIGDKRPEIIASLVCAEIIAKFARRDCADGAENAKLMSVMGAVHGG